jgi:hypothetical protein
MNAPTTAPALLVDAAPIEEFSHCHEGILKHLQELGSLPGLLEPAARARRIACAALVFFREAVFEHHAQEESELFPAVLASAAPGYEREQVKIIAQCLTREHRRIEADWAALEPALKKVAKGRDVLFDAQAIDRLIRAYHEHAEFEEQIFLPLCKTILGRNGDHMAALGLSLHMRHVLPQVLQRFASAL